MTKLLKSETLAKLILYWWTRYVSTEKLVTPLNHKVQLKLFNIMHSFMLLGVNNFIVVALRPSVCSEYHSKPASLMI